MTAQEKETKDKKPIWCRVEYLPAGRARLYVERGALDHLDQLNLSSERQRLRFAQACEAKEPGCFHEIMEVLLREQRRQRNFCDPKLDDGCRFVMTGAEKLLNEDVDWLWERYIPAGAVTILEGEPGVGKSLVLADLAARVSRGFLAPNRNPAFDEPGHDPEPRPELVWWFSGQVHCERTLAPRLRAAGADLPMIRVIEGVEDMKANRCRPVSFPEDFNTLWRSQASAPRLVIVDPLTSFCGSSFHQATAKKVLGELAKFAAVTGAAVVVVRPLNRRLGASASERGSAGPSLTAEARSALLLATHPDDHSKQVLAVVKSNYCAKAASLELQIVDESEREELEVRNGGKDAISKSLHSSSALRRSSPAPRVAWLGESPFMADELVATKRTATSRSPFEERKVEEWLVEKLMNGPKPAKEIDEQAKLDEIPTILLRRAKVRMQIVPTGSNGHTMWRLPDVAFERQEREGRALQDERSDGDASADVSSPRTADDESLRSANRNPEGRGGLSPPRP